ncbi:hypothetical protein L1D22_10175 [Vibrio sp. Isolate34]|uniref:hypothetical protein n=1 Tax=Vibrio sp. Isolate34 TaxID=2908540 RepID=UPI001EFE2534|nr:hypothetical protein [Vibrio sp. Isolate34]MCG9640266.1 hypothetical protein [Vibrio sp. Isolate34]
MLSNAGASESVRNDEFSATMGEKLNWVKRIKMVVKIKEIYRLTKLKYRCPKGSSWAPPQKAFYSLLRGICLE